jgi:hypothetical protein
MFKFELPNYADVKSFWSNYFAHAQKFWTDFAADVKEQNKK